MSESGERLRMEGVGKSFGAVAALDDVALRVRPGEVLAVVGENGAGKSTLMKIAAGVYPADRGRLWLDGEPYRPRNPLDARRLGVAMIHQELSLAPHLSIAENILLGMEPRRAGLLDRPRMRRAAREALATLGRDDLDPDRLVGGLSVAERQLVEIARALAVGCRVLVLDEPTSSLTQAEIPRLFDLVRALAARGHAILYISHFLEEIRAIADRYLVLRDGRLAAEGAVRDTPPETMIRAMVGRGVGDLYVRSPRRPGGEVLRARALRARGNPRCASFELRRGEVLGLAGLVGSGRTELLQALMGLRAVESGEISLHGAPLRGGVRERWRAGIGMVSEDRASEGLALRLGVADNLTLSRLPRWVRAAGLSAAVRRWSGVLDLRCAGPWQPAGELSGGNQQKVALARLLHHGTDVLLLDEPTRGIDIGSKARFYRWLDELVGQGRSVIVAGSYLPELLGICDRIAVMCRGVLGPARPVAEWNPHTLLSAATGVKE